MEEQDYDIIVVGGGGAGMCAAIEAADAGASVLLVDADDRLGGSTALSGGVYYAAGTSVQRARGIEDDADALFDYYMTLNQYRVEASLVRTLCDHAAADLEWLISIGVEFHPEDLYASGVERDPRGHQAHGHGAAIAAALDAEVSRRPGIDVALQTRAEQLLEDAQGRIIGVRAGDTAVTARSVVIASGGFGANPHLLHRHYPEATAHGDWTWYIGSRHCLGDGLEMAASAGADIVGHNRGLLLTTPNFRKELEVFVPGWLVYVNREGRRFVKETAEYAVMSGVVKAQTGGSCFALFDDVARAGARPDPRFADAFASGVLSLNWVTETLDEQIKTGRVIRADDLDELARRCGIRPGSLQATLERYNRDCAAGCDSMFFKDPAVMKPVATPPFHAVEIRPAIVCLTSTGIRIDREAQVLDGRDRPVEGLFAAGETTGGVLGERYVGGGNSIANAVVFGRIAGRSAARAAGRSN